MADLDEGSLRGVRVLDATQMLAGPRAATRLGDLGADVIKVEPPGGEFNRTHGFEDIRVEGEMSTFLAVNRNKRSFCVNLKSPEGLAAFLDLARSADVVLQNFRHAPPTAWGSLRRSLGPQPAAGLLLDLGLRRERPVPGSARPRPDHPGLQRVNVLCWPTQRRSVARCAMGGRHHDRLPGRHRDPGRAPAP